MHTYDLDGVVLGTPQAEAARVLPAALRGGLVEQAVANLLFPGYDLLPGFKSRVENGTIKEGNVSANADVLRIMQRDLDDGIRVLILTSRENTDASVRKMLDANDLKEVGMIHTSTGKKSKPKVVRDFMNDNPQLKIRHLDDGIREACGFVMEFGAMPDCFRYFRTWHTLGAAHILQEIVQVMGVKDLLAEKKAGGNLASLLIDAQRETIPY